MANPSPNTRVVLFHMQLVDEDGGRGLRIVPQWSDGVCVCFAGIQVSHPLKKTLRIFWTCIFFYF